MLQTENTWLVTSYTHLTNRYPVSAAARLFAQNSLFLSFIKKHFFLKCSYFSWVMLSTAIVKVNVTANTFLRECQAGYLTVISIPTVWPSKHIFQWKWDIHRSSGRWQIYLRNGSLAWSLTFILMIKTGVQTAEKVPGLTGSKTGYNKQNFSLLFPAATT